MPSRLLAAFAWLMRVRYALSDALLVLLVSMSLAASGASPAPPVLLTDGALDALDSAAPLAPREPARAHRRDSFSDGPSSLEPRSVELAPGGARDAAADTAPRSTDDSQKAGFDPGSLTRLSSIELGRAWRLLDARVSPRAERALRSAPRDRPRARAPPVAA